MSTDPPFDPKRPPLRGLWRQKHPIPDLAQIPREHWLEVLRRTHPEAAEYAHFDLPGDQQLDARLVAAQAWLDGPITPHVPAEAVAYPPSLPGTGVEPSSAKRDRQVNFRLPPPVFAELERAAGLVHMRPTALARLLVTRGVTQILQEATERG
jgi:hypothetical protein